MNQCDNPHSAISTSEVGASGEDQERSSGIPAVAAAAAMSPPADEQSEASSYDGILRYYAEDALSVTGLNSVVSSSTQSSDRKPHAVEQFPRPEELSSLTDRFSSSDRCSNFENESHTVTSSRPPRFSSQETSSAKSIRGGTYRPPISRDHFKTTSMQYGLFSHAPQNPPTRAQSQHLSASLQSSPSRPRPPSLRSCGDAVTTDPGASEGGNCLDVSGSRALSSSLDMNGTGLEDMLVHEFQRGINQPRHQQPYVQSDLSREDVHLGSSPTILGNGHGTNQGGAAVSHGSNLGERFKANDETLIGDEELARRLQEEEEAMPLTELRDKEFARRLHDCEQSLLEEQKLNDEELARKMQADEEKAEELRRRSRMQSSLEDSPMNDEVIRREMTAVSMHYSGDAGSEGIEEQYRILENIRREEERKQLEWAMEEKPSQQLEWAMEEKPSQTGQQRPRQGGFTEPQYTACQQELGRGHPNDWQESQRNALSEYATTYRRQERQYRSSTNIPDIEESQPQSQQELQRRQIVERGQEETADAIRTGQSHVVLCRGCNSRLQAPVQYSLVYCPACGKCGCGYSLSACKYTLL